MKNRRSEKHSIVQISLDEDMFNENAAQDTRLRQVAYGHYLKENYKNTHLVNIILTNKKMFRKEVRENVTLIPCNFYRLRHIISLMTFLRKLHRENKISLVTTQDIHGIFWGAVLFSHLAKVPIIGQIHYDLSSEYARNEWFVEAYGKYYERLVLYFVRFFNGIRVVNSATRDYLITMSYKGQISVCPVPATTFRINEDYHHEGWKYSDALHVLYVGRFVRVKNLSCWMETARLALSKNDNIEFILVGDGEGRDRMEILCENMGISSRVQFLGALTPEEVAKWYASADVFLLTSLYEGFGRVLIEAMNYKVVPVCTNVAGPKDIISNGVDGFLVKLDPELLANHLIELEGDRTKLNKMGSNAKAKVEEKYSSNKLRQCWLDFVMSFVEGASR